jgi:predicted dehydrogenase
MPRKASHLKLAVVGCGAVVERMYLPVLVGHSMLRVHCLADVDLVRARELAAAYGVPMTANSWQELAENDTLIGEVDAVLICLPHSMHSSAAMALMNRGKHVLCDKPMAVSAAECEAMITTARRNSVILTVPLVRRFYHKNLLIRHLLESGVLGDIRSFEFIEGFDFRWPTVSGFVFDRILSGGGVLIDTGAHTLDTVRSWFGLPRRFEYFDDNTGGVEATCEIRLHYDSGIEGRIRLSRIDPIGEKYIVSGTRATLSTGCDHASPVVLDFRSFSMSCTPERMRNRGTIQTFEDAVSSMFENFVDACQFGTPLNVLPAEAAEVVAWIERCYSMRRPLNRPWELVAQESDS